LKILSAGRLAENFDCLSPKKLCQHYRGKKNADILSEGRNLVNTAVKLINGYMNYLKRAGEKQAVHEDVSPYGTFDRVYNESDNQ